MGLRLEGGKGDWFDLGSNPQCLDPKTEVILAGPHASWRLKGRLGQCHKGDFGEPVMT